MYFHDADITILRAAAETSTATPSRRSPKPRAILYVHSFPDSAKLSAMPEKCAVYEGSPVSAAVAEARTQKADLNMVSIAALSIVVQRVSILKTCTT